jgi:hypothetical protein
MMKSPSSWVTRIGHVTARHGAERMSQGLLVAVGGVILGCLHFWEKEP